MNDPREAKLPRWAQALLASERRRANEAVSALEEHKKSVEPTRIWHGSSKNPIFVPEQDGYQTIRFDMGHHRKFYDEIKVRFNDDGLQIAAGRRLIVEPVVSNVVQISLKD
ncbi:hypothetical protein KIV65_gp39 [Mycobacterium phage Anthony]|uniref:Uncharacterized protein n=1 Tax=Mycobacterium phage Anthony TaxID=2599857 RepID=A0A5J6TJ64_9CAUD|nr:hypothetical protein KIV65_gp39 [Mycobacterium phage Anthony]QFG10428.1 hypothetical protein PBI_ANTHONY_58 [Mycobacterium phage Anthony]